MVYMHTTTGSKELAPVPKMRFCFCTRLLRPFSNNPLQTYRLQRCGDQYLAAHIQLTASCVGNDCKSHAFNVHYYHFESSFAASAQKQRHRHSRRSSVNIHLFLWKAKDRSSSLMLDGLLLASHSCLPQSSGEAFVLSWWGLRCNYIVPVLIWSID